VVDLQAMTCNKLASIEFLAKVAVQLLLYGTSKEIVGFNNWFIFNIPRTKHNKLMMKIKKQLASLKK
jgi:hypothetical protein